MTDAADQTLRDLLQTTCDGQYANLGDEAIESILSEIKAIVKKANQPQLHTVMHTGRRHPNDNIADNSVQLVVMNRHITNIAVTLVQNLPTGDKTSPELAEKATSDAFAILSAFEEQCVDCLAL